MVDVSEVVIDPRCRLPYTTYLLKGFADLGVPYRIHGLAAPSAPGVALTFEGRRIWFDADDRADLNDEVLEWADVYAKTNCLLTDIESHPSLQPTGPVFGVQLWPLPRGYLELRRWSRSGAGWRQTLAGLRFQGITRLPIEQYRPGSVDEGYVFHRSRAWAGNHTAANEPRQRFITALQRLGLGADAALVEDRISLSEYLRGCQRSTLVFNAPAVHGCLGWKLGEYLALGKAIVSTPLDRALPAPLVHGEHVHFVDDDTLAMVEAVERIIGDVEYRRHLERGARRWFEQHLTPAVVARRLLEWADEGPR